MLHCGGIANYNFVHALAGLDSLIDIFNWSRQVSAPEIVSGMSGESEAKIRGLFDDAVVRKLVPLLLPVI
jgi:hypothetical protein